MHPQILLVTSSGFISGTRRLIEVVYKRVFFTSGSGKVDCDKEKPSVLNAEIMKLLYMEIYLNVCIRHRRAP